MSTSVLPAITFREVLLAFDFSDASERALEYARAIARQHNSRLVLVHVVEGHIPVSPGTEWIEEDAVRISEQVDTAGMALRGQGFEAESLNRFGTLTEQVRDLAESRHIDLILAGTHAGQGIDRAIFGSNAEKLARSIDCPVMLIGPKCRQPGETWKPLRILAATRLYPARAKVAIYASRLAQLNQAHWKLMHVAHTGQPFEREVWDAYLQEVQQLAPDVLIGENEQKVVFSERHASREIIDTAHDCHADLIVMGASHDSLGFTHFRRGALGEVLAEATCPVITVRH
jgi:nucleotide-binding universal stress UspA family protein